MTVNEMIEFLEEDSLESIELVEKGFVDNNFRIVNGNANTVISNVIQISLLIWRSDGDPGDRISRLMDLIPGFIDKSLNVNPVSARDCPLDLFDTIYAAYLIDRRHPPVDLTVLKEQPKITGFFGNVLMGYADIADWPQYRDAIPKNKRYDLARRINELYSGLLAGSVSAEDGVRLGEQLWAEREHNTFFDTDTGGFGKDNETMVDYKLGAILKKIGSTVPTVHAWRW